jgi:monoamine oxidase
MVWWTQHPVSAPMLVAWAGGPSAHELTRSGAVEDVVLAELAHVFGVRRARAESLVESIHWHDWSSDPSARGAYSYVGVGGVSAPRTLARSIGGRVFMAGEATDAESGGTVEAALASGERAARAVVRALAV